MDIKNYNIISIDPSRKCTGIYSVKDGQEKWNTYSLEIYDNHTMLSVLYDIFSVISENNKYHIALIEDYAYNVRSNSLTMLAEIAGTIKAALKWTNIIEVPILMWKSLTIGIGAKKGTKEKNRRYLEDVYFRFGKEFNSVDVADAFMMHKAVELIMQTDGVLTEAQYRLRKKITEILAVTK